MSAHRPGQVVGHEYVLCWRPQGEPPDGLPRELGRAFSESSWRLSPEARALGERLGALGYGTGWVLYVSAVVAPSRRSDPAARARIRQGNLVRRMTSKAPLFADELISKELSSRPAYFQGERDAEHERFLQQVHERDQARYAAFLAWQRARHAAPWWPPASPRPDAPTIKDDPAHVGTRTVNVQRPGGLAVAAQKKAEVEPRLHAGLQRPRPHQLRKEKP